MRAQQRANNGNKRPAAGKGGGGGGSRSSPGSPMAKISKVRLCIGRFVQGALTTSYLWDRCRDFHSFIYAFDQLLINE